MHAPGEDDNAINQPPPFGDINLAQCDAPLLDALAGFGAARQEALRCGESSGGADQLALGRLANTHTPVLHTHDSRGRRADIVEFHPAYHALMAQGVAAGLHCSTWETHPTALGADQKAAARHVGRAALLYLKSQVEAGHICPLTMTHAAPAALAAAPDLARDWLPRIRSRTYDGRFLPYWEKAGVTLGMGMTERQGGTDVRSNTTRATPTGGQAYEITGAKWFFSAPMSDAFLILAQAPKGLTCFLLPRFRPDGRVNALRLLRLKDKLGNRSNASAEVEFDKAFAWLVGEEGRGIATIIGMVQLTRLDCAVSSAALMRMALTLALHHAAHRTVFQKKLIDQPAMREVLADLALEVEGTSAVALRLAASFGGAPHDEKEAARARFLTPAVKFSVCKAAPGFIYEAMEALGGNGYVEESPLPRLYREAPVNAIWEGSGTVMALDLVRAAEREPDQLRALLDDLVTSTQGLDGAAAAAGEVERLLLGSDRESTARLAAEQLAALATAAALVERGPAEIAEAFAHARLSGRRAVAGTSGLTPWRDLLVERALFTPVAAERARAMAGSAGHH